MLIYTSVVGYTINLSETKSMSVNLSSFTKLFSYPYCCLLCDACNLVDKLQSFGGIYCHSLRNGSFVQLPKSSHFFMGERRGVYSVLVEKPEGKGPFGSPRPRWEYHIKMDLQEVGVEEWTGSSWLRIRTGGGHL